MWRHLGALPDIAAHVLTPQGPREGAGPQIPLSLGRRGGHKRGAGEGRSAVFARIGNGNDGAVGDRRTHVLRLVATVATAALAAACASAPASPTRPRPCRRPTRAISRPPPASPRRKSTSIRRPTSARPPPTTIAARWRSPTEPRRVPDPQRRPGRRRAQLRSCQGRAAARGEGQQAQRHRHGLSRRIRGLLEGRRQAARDRRLPRGHDPRRRRVALYLLCRQGRRRAGRPAPTPPPGTAPAGSPPASAAPALPRAPPRGPASAADVRVLPTRVNDPAVRPSQVNDPVVGGPSPLAPLAPPARSTRTGDGPGCGEVRWGGCWWRSARALRLIGGPSRAQSGRQ